MHSIHRQSRKQSWRSERKRRTRRAKREEIHTIYIHRKTQEEDRETCVGLAESGKRGARFPAHPPVKFHDRMGTKGGRDDVGEQ